MITVKEFAEYVGVICIAVVATYAACKFVKAIFDAN